MLVLRRSVLALLSQTFCPAFLSRDKTSRNSNTTIFITIEGKHRSLNSFIYRKVFPFCIMSAQLIHNSCIFIWWSENFFQTSNNLLLTAMELGLWSWLSFPWLTKADWRTISCASSQQQLIKWYKDNFVSLCKKDKKKRKDTN